MSILHRFITWLRDPRHWDPHHATRMKEDRIPTDRMGRPDLAHYTEPVDYYERMFDAYLDSFNRALTRDESTLAWKRRVHAEWGLIAKGAGSVPYALRLLRTVIPAQRWGIGQARPPAWALYLKGGWGSGSGAVDHQVALLRRGRRRLALAILTVGNPSHEYGNETLEGVARRLLRGLGPRSLPR